MQPSLRKILAPSHVSAILASSGMAPQQENLEGGLTLLVLNCHPLYVFYWLSRYTIGRIHRPLFQERAFISLILITVGPSNATLQAAQSGILWSMPKPWKWKIKWRSSRRSWQRLINHFKALLSAFRCEPLRKRCGQESVLTGWQHSRKLLKSWIDFIPNLGIPAYYLWRTSRGSISQSEMKPRLTLT